MFILKEVTSQKERKTDTLKTMCLRTISERLILRPDRT
jgi:hypothetical protein